MDVIFEYKRWEDAKNRLQDSKATIHSVFYVVFLNFSVIEFNHDGNFHHIEAQPGHITST